MKYLIVGLGNPGPDYYNTRHNIGFLVLDELAKKAEVSFSDRRYAFVAESRLKNKQLVLIKPTTYMNLSGKALRYWANEHKIPIENILVVTDDVALPLGKIRLRMKGGAGGHNGLADIISVLGTDTIARLRFGVGGDYPKGAQVHYVLGKFPEAELKELQPKIQLACEAIETFALQGITKAMNNYNNL